MSGPRFSIIPSTAVSDRRLRDLDVRVLCVYGANADKNGWCHRSQSKIAEQLDIARESVCRATTRLVKAGYLERRDINEVAVREGRKKKGLRSINVYRVLMDSSEGPVQETIEALCTGDHNAETEVETGAALCAPDHNGCDSPITTVVTARSQPNDSLRTAHFEQENPYPFSGEGSDSLIEPCDIAINPAEGGRPTTEAPDLEDCAAETLVHASQSSPDGAMSPGQSLESLSPVVPSPSVYRITTLADEQRYAELRLQCAAARRRSG